MMRHDEALLWEYAARELSSEDARLVQHHLTECPDCQEKLTDVKTARGALQAARGLAMSFPYAKTDAVLSKTIEKRMEKAVFGRSWVIGLSGALVTAGLALVVYGMANMKPSPVPVVAAIEVPVVKRTPSVEQAVGLTVIGAQTRLVQAGSTLASGDVLRTGGQGEATLKLPEGTRLALSPSSQLSLTRAEADDITLALEHGHVAVAASHARRKGFVVHANGAMVTVVGTTFSVTSSRDGIEVAVAEGKVSIEPPVGLPQFVSAGQKVRFDSKWKSMRTPLSAREKKELAGIGGEVIAPPAPPPTAPAPAPVRHAVVPAAGGPQPSLKDLVASADVAPLPAPVAAAPSPPPPATTKPDMSGLDVPLLASPVESVNPARANDWAPMPEAPVTPTRASKLKDEIPEDAEAIFLTHAERSLAHGTCDRFILGLEDLALDRKNPRAEKARLLRARCFDNLMNTRQAEMEYRKYLLEYPVGQFTDEAKAFLNRK